MPHQASGRLESSLGVAYYGMWQRSGNAGANSDSCTLPEITGCDIKVLIDTFFKDAPHHPTYLTFIWVFAFIMTEEDLRCCHSAETVDHFMPSLFYSISGVA